MKILNIKTVFTCCLLAIGLIIIWSGCDLINPPKDDRNFAIADTASIAKIYLADMNKNACTLTRKGKEWLVNEKYPVRTDAIRLLLTTMHDIRMNRPVAKSAHNTVVTDMASNAVKVEVYDKENKLLKSYYVGSPTDNYRANLFLMKDAKQPYIVDIPGFDGYVSIRYYTKENDWRSRNIFSYRVADIKNIGINYLDENNALSFQLSQINPDSFAISIPGRINQKEAFKYFELFRNINSVAYANEHLQGLDTIKQRPPFCRIIVEDINGKINTVDLVHMLTNKRSKMQYDIKGNEVKYDVDNYYAWVNNHTDFVQVQDFMFRKLLVKPQYFLLKK